MAFAAVLCGYSFFIAVQKLEPQRTQRAQRRNKTSRRGFSRRSLRSLFGNFAVLSFSRLTDETMTAKDAKNTAKIAKRVGMLLQHFYG